MGKALSEMTIEELWKLFPIILTEHKDCWEEWYEAEKQRLLNVLPPYEYRINHIGSTAIRGIWAKPIVDILIEIKEECSMEEIKEVLTNNGYICMSEEERRKSFNRGYTAEGFAEQVFHLHLRYRGDNDELYFRDYMNANPVSAKQYEELKLSIKEKYKHNRDAYTEAKSEFVKKYTRCAKENAMQQELINQYGITADSIEKSAVGAGSDTYFIRVGDKKYVMKFPSISEINNPKLEPKLCEYLNRNGIPACRFLKNRKGEYLSRDKDGKDFHLQEFVEGKMYEVNQAPEWLLTEQAEMLGNIHRVLKEYKGLPEGIGGRFFQYMTPERALKSYQESLVKAEAAKDEEIREELFYRIELMKRFPKYSFELSALTLSPTHGDYFISQLICGEEKINAVIDWTTACVHPVVWEIMRSYVYAAKECAEGSIDIERFKAYVNTYMNYAPLNREDLRCIASLFYYQIAVCDYYGQYYNSKAANRNIYLSQARLSTGLIKWFENNIEKICFD